MSRWLPLAIVVALLGAAMVAAVWGELPVGLRPPGPVRTLPPRVLPAQTPVPIESGEPDVPQATVHVPPWVGYLISGLCIAIVLGLVIALIWTLLRDRLGLRRTPSDVTDPAQVRRQAQEAVRAAVDEGLADLDVADADPRRAVIACWVRLEAAAAAAGTQREPGDTSTELVQRLLAEHAVSAPVLAGFAEIYRWARFATHEVDEAMRERARAALLQVRDELVFDVGGVL
jgi:hypothetical protein